MLINTTAGTQITTNSSSPPHVWIANPQTTTNTPLYTSTNTTVIGSSITFDASVETPIVSEFNPNRIYFMVQNNTVDYFLEVRLFDGTDNITFLLHNGATFEIDTRVFPYFNAISLSGNPEAAFNVSVIEVSKNPV